MTKARARERAKANALKKAKKKVQRAKDPDQQANGGHFEPGNQSIKGPGGNNKGNNFAPARRGAVRSG